MATPNMLLLYGNDEYAMNRRLAEFESMFSDPTSASMNMTRLEGGSWTEDDLNNAVNAMPFLAKQRLVLLERPSERYSTPERREKFCGFLEKAPETTRLVITEHVELKWKPHKADQDKEDDRNWPVKWFRKKGLGLERFALPAQRDMPAWIVKQAREAGGQIDAAAAAKLAEMVGTNTQQASQEITKLLTYVNWQRPVNILDVQAVSIVTAEAHVFDMVDALAQGQGRQAQLLMRRLLADQEPFGVWAMIIRQFRLLIQAREVIDAGGGLPEVWKQLGGSEFVAKKAYNQARRFSMPVLERIYHRLLDIDVAAKTGGTPLDVSMDMLVAELTG
jgi:DNA polymerase III subunit delta